MIEKQERIDVIEVTQADLLLLEFASANAYDAAGICYPLFENECWDIPISSEVNAQALLDLGHSQAFVSHVTRARDAEAERLIIQVFGVGFFDEHCKDTSWRKEDNLNEFVEDHKERLDLMKAFRNALQLLDVAERLPHLSAADLLKLEETEHFRVRPDK